MFISLYGGLIIILRLIAPILIRLFVKVKQALVDNNIYLLCENIQPKKFVRLMKQLNLFKHIERRTEDDIKQQKITTRIYLILLSG